MQEYSDVVRCRNADVRNTSDRLPAFVRYAMGLVTTPMESTAVQTMPPHRIKQEVKAMETVRLHTVDALDYRAAKMQADNAHLEAKKEKLRRPPRLTGMYNCMLYHNRILVVIVISTCCDWHYTSI